MDDQGQNHKEDLHVELLCCTLPSEAIHDPLYMSVSHNSIEQQILLHFFMYLHLLICAYPLLTDGVSLTYY